MKKYLLGVLLCLLLAFIATLLSNIIPIGSVTIVILLGMILNNIKTPATFFSIGITYSEKVLLSVSIALMGVNLNYNLFLDLGFSFIVIVIVGIIFTILLAILLGRLMKIDSDLALLVGVGNGICGSSAIAAAQGVVNADEDKVGISIAVINFLGTIGIFLLPGIILLLPFLSETRGAVLIGNTLQAIGQVSAAGFSISQDTGQIATLVKMGRILMIMPVVLILGFVKKNPGSTTGKRVGVPLYIIGFIIFSLLGTLQILPENIILIIKTLSKWFLVTAMAAIGMKIKFSDLRGGGKDALKLGSIVFGIQILISICLVTFLIKL